MICVTRHFVAGNAVLDDKTKKMGQMGLRHNVFVNTKVPQFSFKGQLWFPLKENINWF